MQAFVSCCAAALRVLTHGAHYGVVLMCATYAYAGTTIVAPATAGGSYVNGVLFSVTATSDVSRVELTANGFAFGTLNTANNWQTRYTFTNIGTRDIAFKSYDAASTLLSTKTLSINVVDVLMANPTANSVYANGTPVTISASAAVTTVILKAETFEIGRAGVRDAANQFVILPAVMSTIGARTFNLEAYNANNARIATQAVPVTVTNISMVSPANGASFNSGQTFAAQVQAVSTTARVDYYADTVFLESVTNASTQFRRDTSLVNAGSRVIKAVAFNASGTKLGEASSTITINATSCTPPKILQNGVCVDPPPATCQFGAWQTYNGVSLRRHLSGAYIYKTANKNIDADGAPNAYHPADVGKPCSASAGLLGLDCPANAGYPNGGFWRDVLVVDPNDSSKPYVQPSGAYAGFFIAKTSLQDTARAPTDIARYVNSSTIPYVVFPGNFYSLSGTGRMGDLGFAINLSNNKKTHYVAADVGPSSAPLGEMSIAMQVALGGVNPNPINGAGAPSGTILYVGFPNSTATYSWPMTNAQMSANIQQLLSNVGGEAGVLACQNSL
jgi:hypothetical protein